MRRSTFDSSHDITSKLSTAYLGMDTARRQAFRHTCAQPYLTKSLTVSLPWCPAQFRRVTATDILHRSDSAL